MVTFCTVLSRWQSVWKYRDLEGGHMGFKSLFQILLRHFDCPLSMEMRLSSVAKEHKSLPKFSLVQNFSLAKNDSPES